MKNLANQFTIYAIYSGVAVFIILIIMTIVVATVAEDTVKSGETKTKNSMATLIFRDLPKHVNVVVVLIVVAIPEGLPLTIGIALAFSVLRMYKRDNILVRKHDAPEKIAEIEEFLIGKTATITKNKMRVKKFYFEGRQIDNNRKDTLFNCELDALTIKLVQEGIMYNNAAYVEMGETKYVPVGDGTEVGLVRFLQNADVPVHTLINDRFAKVIATKPKSSEKNE